LHGVALPVEDAHPPKPRQATPSRVAHQPHRGSALAGRMEASRKQLLLTGLQRLLFLWSFFCIFFMCCSLPGNKLIYFYYLFHTPQNHVQLRSRTTQNQVSWDRYTAGASSIRSTVIQNGFQRGIILCSIGLMTMNVYSYFSVYRCKTVLC
jgi:hypothetical protein